MHILICSVEDQQYAFDLSVVERAILAIETIPVPHAPKHVLGAINVHGRIIPVISLRELLDLPKKEIDINDHFVICRVGNQEAALWVDNVQMVQTCHADKLIPGHEIMPHLNTVRYALKEADTVTLILDLDVLIPGFVTV